MIRVAKNDGLELHILKRLALSNLPAVTNQLQVLDPGQCAFDGYQSQIRWGAMLFTDLEIIVWWLWKKFLIYSTIQ